MKFLLVLALSFISTHCHQNPGPTQGACARNGLRLVHKIGDNYGALQVCTSQYGWRYITPSDWTQAATRLACRQLNLGYMNAASGSLRLSSNAHTWRIRDAACIEDACKLNDCTDYIGEQQITVVIVNCVDCTDGAMRLVDGTTVSEGRLEICHNGQWGTICNQGWTDSRAGQVCSRLGLPTYNATLHQFNGGTGSVYTLNCPTTDSNCIQESSCAHSMDVGVRCLPFTDACAVPVNEVIATVETPTACNCQQPTTSTPPTPIPTIGRCTPANIPGDGNGNEMSTSKQPAISTETPQPNNGTTTESSISQSTVMSTSGTLGALIGLLAALVVVVTGWIVSCVYFQRKINRKCKDHTHTTSASTSDPTLQLNNPVYDGSTTGTVPHTTYSSHGPSYEVIDTNEGARHSYDVISRRGATRPRPHATPPVSNEEYSTLDTSRENEYHTLEINTGDGQYSMVGQTDPQNDRPDPQDYDLPAPPQGEEYSTLKH